MENKQAIRLCFSTLLLVAGYLLALGKPFNNLKAEICQAARAEESIYLHILLSLNYVQNLWAIYSIDSESDNNIYTFQLPQEFERLGKMIFEGHVTIAL